nr:hypothetical protein [uncultured Campylobacter sp.]
MQPKQRRDDINAAVDGVSTSGKSKFTRVKIKANIASDAPPNPKNSALL